MKSTFLSVIATNDFCYISKIIDALNFKKIYSTFNIRPVDEIQMIDFDFMN